MKSRGFTIIELVIVISIVCILTVLGVVNLRGSVANGRDSERKADIDSIAAHLETYYDSGDPADSAVIGEYPSTTKMTVASIHQTIPDIDNKSITAPNVTDPSSTFSTAVAGVNPSPSFDQYIYQPLQADGSLCTDNSTQECVRFKIYYKLEVDSIIHVKESKNQ